MSTNFVELLTRRLDGTPDLVQILTEQMSGSELNSLLLEVFQQKTNTISPAALLQSYRNNRFVTPVNSDWLPFLEQEINILQFAKNQGFEPLELSPLSPLGTCAVVGTVHQHKVMTALRGTEVVADATNVLALESAIRRRNLMQQDKKSSECVRLCTTHRHVRAASIAVPGFTPHFKIFCCTTAGRDTGNFTFETQGVLEQLRLHFQLLTQVYQLPLSRLSLLFKNLHINNYNPAFEIIHRTLQENLPEVAQTVQNISQTEANYYRSFQFKILLHLNGNAYDIGDGGLVDWTQQLLNNGKERLLISGIGTEFLHRLLH